MRRILTQGDLWLAPKLSGEMICVTLSCDLCPAPWSCSVCCGDVADTNSCRVNLDNWKVNRKEAPQLQSPVTSTNTVIVMSTPIHTQTVTLSIYYIYGQTYNTPNNPTRGVNDYRVRDGV